MEFNLRAIRGFAAEAATALTRAVQYTEEKLGTSEKTELDEQYDALAEKCDKAKLYTEKVVNSTVSVLEPNPNIRIEDYLLEKIDKKQERHRNLEFLGGDMIDAGLEFGAQTIYGSALIKVGQTQQQLGKTEKQFVQSSIRGFVRPLRKFLDEDVKTIMKERKLLEQRRLDLDVAKNRIKKAKSLESQANAEADLKIAEEKFERQVEITKLLMEGISSAQANHVRCLSEFVDAQIQFYTKCHEQMIELQRELAVLSSESTNTQQSTLLKNQNLSHSSAKSTNNNDPQALSSNNNLMNSKNANLPLSLASQVSQTSDSLQQVTSNNGIFKTPVIVSPTDDTIPFSLPDNKRRARVLYDYEAQNKQQLNVQSNEVIIVDLNASTDADYLLAERGSQRGQVPVAYLEILK